MSNKELILDCLIDDDEAFTQIVEYFELAAEIKISSEEIKKLLNEVLEIGNDLNFKTGNVGAPSWLVKEISISGK